MSESADNRRLEEELVRLRAENQELRAKFRVDPPEPDDVSITAEGPREVRVLLLPDPLRAVKPGVMGPQTVANVARVLVSAMKERQPDVDWRAEHDLDRIPEDAQCFQLGEVGSRLMTGAGPWPKTFSDRPIRGVRSKDPPMPGCGGARYRAIPRRLQPSKPSLRRSRGRRGGGVCGRRTAPRGMGAQGLGPGAGSDESGAGEL